MKNSMYLLASLACFLGIALLLETATIGIAAPEPLCPYEYPSANTAPCMSTSQPDCTIGNGDGVICAAAFEYSDIAQFPTTCDLTYLPTYCDNPLAFCDYYYRCQY